MKGIIMKKTYYVYYVAFIGKTIDGNIIKSCVTKSNHPITDSCYITEITEKFKNDLGLVERPVIICLTPLGKTRL